MDMEKLEKYFPWLLAAGAVGAGIYLFKSGTGVTEGVSYTSLAPQDVSAMQAAAIQQQQIQLQAKVAGFDSIVTTVNNQMAAEYELKSLREQAAYQTTIANINARSQELAIRSQASTQRHASNTSAFASVIGTVAMAAILACYRTTELAQNNRRIYTHGRVAA